MGESRRPPVHSLPITDFLFVLLIKCARACSTATTERKVFAVDNTAEQTSQSEREYKRTRSRTRLWINCKLLFNTVPGP